MLFSSLSGDGAESAAAAAAALLLDGCDAVTAPSVRQPTLSTAVPRPVGALALEAAASV
jgi:hypothetical protein